MLKINKKMLVLVAGGVWLFASINVLNIGLTLYKDYVNFINIFFSTVIFILFELMFFKITKKHIKRIHEYEEEKQHILKFFDAKSYIIIMFMMTLGISIRKYELMPSRYIAIFYTAIGLALFLCGVYMIIFYIKDLLKKAK